MEKQLKTKKAKTKKRLSIITILFIITFCVWITTLMPFHPIDGTEVKSMGFLDILIAPFKGFIDRVEFIVFLFTLGIFMRVINKTKCIESSVGSLITKLKNKEVILIPILMLIISVLGSVYGFAEETLIFYPFLVPIILAAGFDTITVIFVLVLGSIAGIAGSIINPFLIGAAADATNRTFAEMGISVEVSILTGLMPRLVTWCITTTSLITFTTIYAIRVKNNNNKSLVKENMKEDLKIHASNIDLKNLPKLNARRIWSLIIFIMTFVVLVVFSLPFNFSWGQIVNDWIQNKGITEWLKPIGKWSFLEYAFLFLFSSIIISFLVIREREVGFVDDIYSGMKDMTGLAIIISMAGGVSVMLRESNLSGWLIAFLESRDIENMNKSLFIFISLIIFIALGFLINSSTSLANLSFPLIAPIAYQIGGTGAGGEKMVGIMFLTFAIGLSLVSLFTPINFVFLTPLSTYKIPLKTWYKAQIIPGTVLLITAVAVPMIYSFL